MFSNISKALSGTEEGETGGSNSDKRTRGDKVSLYTCMNIISLDPRPPIVYKHMWFTANGSVHDLSSLPTPHTYSQLMLSLWRI